MTLTRMIIKTMIPQVPSTLPRVLVLVARPPLVVRGVPLRASRPLPAICVCEAKTPTGTAPMPISILLSQTRQRTFIMILMVLITWAVRMALLMRTTNVELSRISLPTLLTTSPTANIGRVLAPLHHQPLTDQHPPLGGGDQGRAIFFPSLFPSPT